MTVAKLWLVVGGHRFWPQANDWSWVVVAGGSEIMATRSWSRKVARFSNARSIQKAVFKNVTIFTGKQLWWSLSLNKITDLQVCNFVKKNCKGKVQMERSLRSEDQVLLICLFAASFQETKTFVIESIFITQSCKLQDSTQIAK